jgi:hypothetical protein
MRRDSLDKKLAGRPDKEELVKQGVLTEDAVAAE